MTLSPLDRLAWLGEALENGLALADLLLDLGGVGCGLVGSLGTVAVAAAAAPRPLPGLRLNLSMLPMPSDHLAKLVHAVVVHAVLGVLNVGHGAVESFHLLELLGHLGELLLGHAQ